MDNLSYIILGAGPTGLTFARSLLALGIDDFVVLEKESSIGGLCRTVSTEWGNVDVGGGHMWNTKYSAAEAFVNRHFGNRWIEYDRHSTIILDNQEIGYPIEEFLWQLSHYEIIECLNDMAHRPLSQPTNFREWVYAKFGKRLAELYMIPYCQKLWGEPLDRLSLSWLHKLPHPNFRKILLSILEKRPDLTNLFHARWKYPNGGGFQSIFNAIAEPIKHKIILSTQIENIEIGLEHIVNKKYRAKKIVTTIPWKIWAETSNFSLKSEINRLDHVGLTVSLVVPISSHAQWSYYPSLHLPYHRRFFAHNWMPSASFDFLETNVKRFVSGGSLADFHNEYAYPVYDSNRDDAITKIKWEAQLNGIISLGRWGACDYANSDVCIWQAMNAATSEVGVTIEHLLSRI